MDQFEDYASLADYFSNNGWVAAKHLEAVKSALAAFANEQRRKGSAKARAAMNKAAEKAW